MSGIGSLLRRHRDAARLTQEELAEQARVSARTISDIERGLRSRVYPDTARRLSVALGLTETESASFLDAARGTHRGSPGRVSGGVPRPLTPLVGRERELQVLVAALGSPSGDRLVTVTGLGGVGKTRLALAAAAELEAAYDGRVHVLALVADQDPAHLVGVLSRSLGAPDRASPEALGAHLAGRPTLLVVDEFEHVLDAAVDLETVLEAAPELRVLATSRRRLGIVGEHEVALTPLPLPEPDDPRWADSPAARLFLERVRAHSPDLTLDARQVVDLCRGLSGIPLALELAAARVRHLPLATLHDRLRSGLGDLTDTAAGVPARHRSMEQVLAWSTESLSSDEARVLLASSLFPGGCRLDALSHLCEDVADVVDVMSHLVDRSLVVVDRLSPAAGAVPRWRMLDVVRDHVRGQFPEPSELRARYLDFHVGLVSRVQQQLGREQEWFAVLAAEEPNVRTALTWAAEEGDAESLLLLAGGMWLFWQARGALVEGRRWLTTGLALDSPTHETTRMTACWGVGWLAYHQGDDDAAQAAADQLEALARRHGNDGALRNAVTLHGMLAISREDSGRAGRLLEDALAIARRLGPGWILATSMLNLGLARLAANDVPRAREVLAEALVAYEELADERFRSRCLAYLGLASLMEDDPTRARALFGQSLAVFGGLAEPAGTAEGLMGIAAVDAATGHETRAARLAGAGERLHESYAGRVLPLEQRATARYFSVAESRIGSETWAREWARGRELMLDEAIELALEER